MKFLLTFIIMLNISSSIYAKKSQEVNDSVVLYSIKKTIENNFYAYPIEQRNGRPIYWVYLSDVDLDNKEWSFAYTITNRRQSYIVDNFNIDTIIDKYYYLLIINYNDLLYKNDKSSRNTLDSSIFYEEPMYPENVGAIIYYTLYCNIKYLRNRFYLSTLYVTKDRDIVPQELNYFKFKGLHSRYQMDEEARYNKKIELYGRNCQDKYNQVVDKARKEKWKQNEYILKLSDACKEMLDPYERKKKFR